MDFRLLGPLEVVEQDRPLALGGSKQRSLLAVLLLHANEVVATERIVDELWGESPPATVAKSIQTYVSRLRKQLGDGRLQTRAPGYVLRVAPSELDVACFERLVAEAGAASDPAEAAPLLAEALALWRGAALADLAYEPFAQPAIARLEEARAAALEQRIDADLAAGRHAHLVGELEGLVREHPLRERLRGQLMLCLYRTGRQADALEAFHSARATLVEQLGIEPGRPLRELHEAILQQEPRLDLARTEPVSPPRKAFIGRGRELAELTRGVDDAFARRGRLFLLAGEPGIGKSRLTEELTARARARGTRVLVGRCWEAGGAPAYWPWVQSLRPYVRDADPDILRAQLREGAADVARILPELRGRLADLDPAPKIESEGARFRLFDSLTGFLTRVADARPLVLVLDDLHAADEPSLLLLRFVTRELAESRVLIVGAYRNVDPTIADPLKTTLAELGREPVTTTLALAGLGEGEVQRFIKLAAPDAPAAELGRAVHAETEGNPLFVGEIVRLLASEGRLGEAAGALPVIPQSVQEVIDRRLRHLPDDCCRLLTIASVLGREFDIGGLACASGLPRDAVLELLDDALETRVIADMPGVSGRMRFAHALIRDAVYHGLTTSQRVRLHRRVGESLETLYAADVDAHLAELAHHFAESAAAAGGAKAVEYARRAGSRAARMLAYEEAARLYEMALESLGPGGSAARCELLLALADALGRAGDAPAARSTFLRAAELARAAELPEMLARAAAGYGGRFLWTHGVADPQLVPLLEDALTDLGEEHPRLRIHLLSRLAAALRHAPTRDRRERISEEALATARRIDDPQTLAYALAATAAALIAPDNARVRLTEGEEIVAQATRARDPERVFDGHEHAYWAAWELGDPDRRAAELAAMVRVANGLRQPAQRWTLATAEGTLALSQGRFQQAVALIEQAAAVGDRALIWSATATRRLQLFMLRREQGRLAGLEGEIRDSAHEFPSPLMHGAVLARVYAGTGQAEAAAALLRELVRRDLRAWHVDEEWLASICLLGETCAIIGTTDTAGLLYELLLPYGSQNAVALPELALDSVNRPLGVLAGMQGRFEEAELHFREARRMNGRMGARPWVAHTLEDHARMLLRRDGQGDRKRADELFSRARATYRELGMHDVAPS